MYARVIQLTTNTGSGQDVVDRIQSDLLPIYRGADGFIAYYIVGAGADTFVTIRVFNDEQTLEAANQTASAESDQILADFDITPSDSGQGDVVLFAQS